MNFMSQMMQSPAMQQLTGNLLQEMAPSAGNADMPPLGSLFNQVIVEAHAFAELVAASAASPFLPANVQLSFQCSVEALHVRQNLIWCFGAVILQC